MNTRIKFARFLWRVGEFIQSLQVVVMKPDDLVEVSRQSYAKTDNVDSWSEDSLVNTGLSADEMTLLESVPVRTGDLLMLGVGGGREAIPLARMGFNVTGVDYVPEMVERAKVIAERHNTTIKGMVQEISRLEVPAESYEVVFLSRAMYSCVPTGARRVEMVKRIHHALKPGGYFLCQYQQNPKATPSRKVSFLRRLIAFFTLGNLQYEDGDMLWLNVEFQHAFPSKEAVLSELEEGGFSNVEFHISKISTRCGAVCKK